jgi:hypothetical protein
MFEVGIRDTFSKKGTSVVSRHQVLRPLTNKAWQSIGCYAGQMRLNYTIYLSSL